MVHKIWLQIEPHPKVFEFLKGRAEIIGPFVRPSEGDLLSEVEDADAVLAGTEFPATRETMQRAVRLKAICRFGIGYDTVDVEAATELGICVTNTPDAPTIAVSEFTFGLMINVTRKIRLADRLIRDGGWLSPSLSGTDLHGKTLGLIGMGRIGSRVAKIAHAFEMHVVVFDPYLDAARAREAGVDLVSDLSGLLRRSDIVSVHVPLTAETEGMLGAAEFAAMKKGSILLNVSRGPIVREDDLYEALAGGHIAGAGIDVWSEEPPDPDNPLLALDNIVAAPHAAGMTIEGRGRSNPAAARQALQVLDGERPKDLVNPEVWEKRRR